MRTLYYMIKLITKLVKTFTKTYFVEYFHRYKENKKIVRISHRAFGLAHLQPTSCPPISTAISHAQPTWVRAHSRVFSHFFLFVFLFCFPF